MRSVTIVRFRDRLGGGVECLGPASWPFWAQALGPPSPDLLPGHVGGGRAFRGRAGGHGTPARPGASRNRPHLGLWSRPGGSRAHRARRPCRPGAAHLSGRIRACLRSRPGPAAARFTSAPTSCGLPSGRMCAGSQPACSGPLDGGLRRLHPPAPLLRAGHGRAASPARIGTRAMELTAGHAYLVTAALGQGAGGQSARPLWPAHRVHLRQLRPLGLRAGHGQRCVIRPA